MNKSEVIEYLETNKDPRGIAHWEKHAENSGGLRSVGIGLTKLRKFAKGVGSDARLAKALWSTDLYEARIVSLLVDDPKKMSIEQAESQVDQLQGGYLAHVFSSCDAQLAKAPFVVDLVNAWVESKDEVRRRCAYGLLYEVSKWKKKTAPTEEEFLAHIDRIEKTYKTQPIRVLMAMGTALMGMGKRSRALNAAALKVVRKIGPIDFDPDGRCDPMDFEKHLTSEYIKKKLGL